MSEAPALGAEVAAWHANHLPTDQGASDNLASRCSPRKTRPSSPVLSNPPLPLSSPSTSVFSIAAMSDQIKELADVPKDFIKDGTQFINR